MTRDPAFVTAHKARHHRPQTIVVGHSVTREGVDVHLINLSSVKILKTLSAPGRHTVVPTKLDLLCVVKNSGCATVVNLAPEGALSLPKKLAAKSGSRGKPLRDYFATFVFGRVDAQKYKVLRILTDKLCSLTDTPTCPVQLFEVLTLDTLGCSTSWRAKQGLPERFFVIERGYTDSVVIKGVVYIVLVDSHGVEPQGIARFNLNTKKWMPSLGQPDKYGLHLKPHHLVLPPNGNIMVQVQQSLAEVNGSLVLARYTFQKCGNWMDDFLLDLWFLVDLDKCQWESKYRIDLNNGIPGAFCRMAYLSSVLEDGKFLLCLDFSELDSEEQHSKLLGLVEYDPETNTLDSKLEDVTDVSHFGVYSGSLSSVQNGWGSYHGEDLWGLISKTHGPHCLEFLCCPLAVNLVASRTCGFWLVVSMESVYLT